MFKNVKTFSVNHFSVFSFLIAVFISISVVIGYMRRQQQLNVSLETAISHADVSQCLKLLKQGADPNFVLMLPGFDNRSVRIKFEDWLHNTNSMRPECRPMELPMMCIVAQTENANAYQATFIAAELVSRGARVNVYDDFGETPLMLAVSYNNLMLVRFLLHHGALVNRKHSDKSALKRAQETIDMYQNAVREKSPFVQSDFTRIQEIYRILKEAGAVEYP